MKRASFSILIAVAIAVLVGGVQDLRAQAPAKPLRYSQRYTPRRPTLSRYLDYFRGNVGLTTQYHTYVRPGQQLDSRLRSQQTLLNRQGQGLKKVNDDLRQFHGQDQRFRRVTAAPTGTGSTFMNYSHYYNSGRGR